MTISELTLSFTDHHDTPLYKPPQDCADIPFESTAPVRSHPSYRGQRNWPGLWWSATMGTHVGYESWLKLDHAMLLDFDTRITAFAAQPFWLHYRHGPHELAGWEYRRRGSIEQPLLGNVAWLAGYRHPRYELPPTGPRNYEPRSPFPAPCTKAPRPPAHPWRYYQSCSTCSGANNYTPTSPPGP